MKQFCTTILFLAAILSYTKAIEREMTINIDPGRKDCFYQNAKAGEVIDFEYQVIDGGHGDLDITFSFADPNGRILLTDFKKSENNHRTEANLNGDYMFCFDNSFSAYNSKTVFFEIIIEDEEGEWGSDEKLEGLQPELVYDITVNDIQEIMNNVRGHLNKVRHLQDLIKSSEARDRNIAEENYFKVNTFSTIQIFVMIAVGVIQVVMVRSLFDDQSKAHKIWKNLNRR